MLFTNQLDFVFWKYEGTGNRNTNDIYWIQNIYKDNLYNLINNYSTLLKFCAKKNISILKLKSEIFNRWFIYG
uniref:Splicing factor 3B subunit 5 n=1 Tax=Lotharella vacuolata TaxID=74820 RepID=A0A0H5BJY2_9EUKA|nr:splicing factor 3B subunit 5 [Lotharella vacuolata]